MAFEVFSCHITFMCDYEGFLWICGSTSTRTDVKNSTLNPHESSYSSAFAFKEMLFLNLCITHTLPIFYTDSDHVLPSMLFVGNNYIKLSNPAV